VNLNHVDLQVSDVHVAREFFEKFFGLRCTYQLAKQIALLEDDAGFSLGVSTLRGVPLAAYAPDFHVGFVLDRRATCATSMTSSRRPASPSSLIGQRPDPPWRSDASGPMEFRSKCGRRWRSDWEARSLPRSGSRCTIHSMTRGSTSCGEIGPLAS
jgi:hypothetical protein